MPSENPKTLQGTRMSNHVELKNVTKRFGAQKAVNQVNLVLKAGESVGLAGHNGAGKSTLIKLILGLITPSEGEVMLLGEQTGSKAGAPVRSQIGYLPETVALHPSLTGLETLAFYAKLKKQPLTKNQELLERVGILQAAGRRVGTYSKGMRQRLALAQALLGEPKVLLFDEPTTGLDPASRQMFYEVVRELNGKGATVLLSTHALAELDGHTDRIVVMRNGVKAADGSMGELHIQSGLPLTVKARLRDGRALSDRWDTSDGLNFRAQCKAEERMNLLAELGSLSGLEYLDIHTPTLDEMYAEFLKREDK
ncbi:ABC transporter ATP-binding protein [Neisseria chenwenguii]|uniref:ABC transporter ATP-binding protein n=1 Tax=Neisseria chenwenguii TaxID=1853278 RepID=A0A220S329_9NEIS|nr:ABC transporter ATP-binding protein [Neisseria chenwenguii]